jgi:hypothetical protein
MTAKLNRVAARDLGQNTYLSDGFVLGTLPGGGYGIRWRKMSGEHVDKEYWHPWEPAGLGARMYWLAWEPPQDPMSIDFEGQAFFFLQRFSLGRRSRSSTACRRRATAGRLVIKGCAGCPRRKSCTALLDSRPLMNGFLRTSMVLDATT